MSTDRLKTEFRCPVCNKRIEAVKAKDDQPAWGVTDLVDYKFQCSETHSHEMTPALLAEQHKLNMRLNNPVITT